MSGSVCEFVEGDLAKNVRLICEARGLDNESQVPVLSFTLESKDSMKTVEVGPGKYKSALFLWELGCRSGENPFRFTRNMKRLALIYFPRDICTEALENTYTTHDIVRTLLLGRNVTVTLYMKE